MSRRERRFQRQFHLLERRIPPLRVPLGHLRRDRWFPVRFPLAVLLTLGGLFWFLPLLGLWMLPAGLLLLAIDLPHLRGPISAVMIRSRRAGQRWLRRWRRR
ncbi:MAG: tryptophan synthase subunit beta [Tabrizicola sp.]